MPESPKPKVYIETSVISYLTGRPSKDTLALARQRVTRTWWENSRQRYQCFVSEVVALEAARGDAEMAAARLAALRDLEALQLTTEVRSLARAYLRQGIVPEGQPDDAAHLAFASVFGIDYLVTWNFRHLANLHVIRRMAQINARLGWPMPVIGTPEELEQDP